MNSPVKVAVNYHLLFIWLQMHLVKCHSLLAPPHAGPSSQTHTT